MATTKKITNKKPAAKKKAPAPKKAKTNVYVFEYRSDYNYIDPSAHPAPPRSWVRDSVEARSEKEALGRLIRRRAREGQRIIEHKITGVY